ncbi:hypothetical protein [Spirosoma spitsbergense]|uniref:hypothetical protein n=1 Tax=Spirosoma spitsbergense TaxID=431554 RepID=UPI00036997B9|nr:hypothetical protein [Spirosoma spitsbergense]
MPSNRWWRAITPPYFNRLPAASTPTLTDAWMLEQCTVRLTQRLLIQQGQNSCSITVLQTFLADVYLRYAYELCAEPNYSVVMLIQSDGIARQQ